MRAKIRRTDSRRERSKRMGGAAVPGCDMSKKSGWILGEGRGRWRHWKETVGWQINSASATIIDCNPRVDCSYNWEKFLPILACFRWICGGRPIDCSYYWGLYVDWWERERDRGDRFGVDLGEKGKLTLAVIGKVSDATRYNVHIAARLINF